MSYENMQLEKSGKVLKVTLNRPEKLNALSPQILEDFMSLFDELKGDPETRFVVFTGVGKAFSTGADLAEAGRQETVISPKHAARFSQLKGHDFIRNLENLEQITIAAVNGYCLGAGLVLAMGCDFRIASENALFGVPETNVGVFYTWGSTHRLASLVGPAKAKEMILTCDMLDANEAWRIGLANKIVPETDLMEAADEMISKISSKAPLAVRITKKLVNASTASNFGDLYICEPELVERLYESSEVKEGMTAFLEKRAPDYSD